jgi:hypothetical protein
LTRIARRLARVLAGAAVAGLALASTASAATCDAPSSHPFTRWLDFASYQQVPGGTFEDGLAGWSAAGGAKIVSGNEPWTVAGDAGDQSVYLPKGASVTSPAFCGGLGYPTVRLFYKGGGLPLLTQLKVDVLYTDDSSLLRSFTLPLVLPSGSWSPTLPLLTLSGLPLLTGSQLALKITAVGAPFTIDDVYVDPYSRY